MRMIKLRLCIFMMAAVFAVIIGGAVIGSSVHALKKPEVGAEMRNPGSKPAPIVPGNPSNPGNSDRKSVV